MKEVLQTIFEELKYLKSQGEENVFVDETSMQILNKLIAQNAKHASPQNEFVKELTFVNKIDLAKIENSEDKEIIKVSKTKDFSLPAIPKPTPFTIKGKSKQEKWDNLKSIVLEDKVCNEHLHEGKNLVFGVGNLDADILFCGEAPGSEEETQAEAFVGRAGQLLTKIITAMGLSRQDVYLANIMNWRPEMPSSGNRPPTKEEMAYCLPFLQAQIDIVKPKVIVALGKTAISGLLASDSKLKLNAIRGNWQEYLGYPLMPTYHPSYLLQYATPQIKRLVWEDMMLVMQKLNIPISQKQQGYFL